ncbi:MAG: UPF0158 family protein [Polyangia bacterium]
MDFENAEPIEENLDEREREPEESEREGSRPVRDDDESERSQPDPDCIRVALDWMELEGALENNSPDLNSFLNTVTGDVIRIFRGSDNAKMRVDEAENDGDYLHIDPISSREQYRWMEEFIESVEDAVLKEKLTIAIDGKGAFRRFKDVLVAYPDDRERWFAMRSAKLRDHISEWLSAKNIEPTNTPPWEGEEEGPRSSRGARFGEDRFGRREGSTDLRQVAHEMVDLVPSRELPSAVAFLEFLRSRRGLRRSRYG